MPTFTAPERATSATLGYEFPNTGGTMPYDSAIVQCPYCHELVDLYVDPDTKGQYVEDCEVCCNPWAVHVTRQEDGEMVVSVMAAQ